MCKGVQFMAYKNSVYWCADVLDVSIDIVHKCKEFLNTEHKYI